MIQLRVHGAQRLVLPDNTFGLNSPCCNVLHTRTVLAYAVSIDMGDAVEPEPMQADKTLKNFQPPLSRQHVPANDTVLVSFLHSRFTSVVTGIRMHSLNNTYIEDSKRARQNSTRAIEHTSLSAVWIITSAKYKKYARAYECNRFIAIRVRNIMLRLTTG
eukprot:6178961-Pleurochrysis_carterae.AAC.4